MSLRTTLVSTSESLGFAYASIRANLLRTLLSLLGIMIGVFCIIAILTFVDSIRLNVSSSIDKLGDKTIFIQKWPWLFDSDYPWWKYINRPEMKFHEMESLKKKMPEAEAIAYSVNVSDKKVTADNNNVAEGITVEAFTEGYDQIRNFDFPAGRYFVETEIYRGLPVCFIGSTLAQNLFKSEKEAVDKHIKVFGRNVRIVGVLAKEGEGIGINRGQDMKIFVPMNFVRNFGTFEEMQYEPTIYVKTTSTQISGAAFEDDLRGTMRSVRKLSPREEDDFSLNKITMITNVMDNLFSQISLLGWIIAGFSILVGGFGIANIMFVSVKERTHIIGIQKALGASSYAIMTQFLGEAIMLCLIGGGVGLGLVWLLATVMSLFFPFQLILTPQNIMIGVGLSSLIGILSGYIPSRQAAHLDPIEAIRSNG